MGSRPLILASANPAKVLEIRELLAGCGEVIDLLPRPADVPDVVEDAETLEGNARLKALALCRATGIGAIADDTGLEVDALGGAPGVHTARFAGPTASAEENVAKLLRELLGVAPEARTARFRTVALICEVDGSQRVAHGVVEGTIAMAPRGSGGFGYDPIFAPDEGNGLTFAEMSSDAKHSISHRGRAFRSLVDQL